MHVTHPSLVHCYKKPPVESKTEHDQDVSVEFSSINKVYSKKSGNICH
jgi:hypothetical protein